MCWTVEERQRYPDQQTKYPRVWANDQHWRANHVILQGKNDPSVQLDNSSRRLPYCGGIPQFSTTNSKQSESSFEYSEKGRSRDRFNELTFTGKHNILFHSSGFFFVSSSYLIVISSASLIIQMENFARVETFSITAEDFDYLGECNQDFVAPAAYHTPIEVVTVRVREHPH